MTGIAPVLGVLAVLVGIGDTIPYVRDTLRGVTRPHRGTWLIWIAAALMIPKTYRDPDSETLATFAFASLGGLLAAGAVGMPDLSLLIYPVYFGLVNGAIAILIHHRRVVLRQVGCEPARGGAIIGAWCAVSRVRSSSGARSNWRRSMPRSRRREEARRARFW